MQVYVGHFNQSLQRISDSGFFNLRDEYGGSEDSEHLSVTVITPSRSKTVRISDFGAAPSALWEIVTLADGVAANLPGENTNQVKVPVISGPVPLRKIQAEYTEQARRAKLEGIVWVQVEVQSDGRVSNEHKFFVINGLGMGLDQKAVEAVK